VGLHRYAGKPLGFYTKLIVGSVNRKEIQKNGRRLLAACDFLETLQTRTSGIRFATFDRFREEFVFC
jgi:hypothetical protein